MSRPIYRWPLVLLAVLPWCLDIVAQDTSALRDIDGNGYKVIIIGNSRWFAENLRTTRFNDGTAIPKVTERGSWNTLSSPGWCWYNNDSISGKKYGVLYNGFAVNTGKLCPDGWHVPTDDEWAALEEYAGGAEHAGLKLRARSDTDWKSPGKGGTDETGFCALPGGTRFSNGVFFSVGRSGYWWSSGKPGALNGWYRSINGNSDNVSRNFDESTNGFSVRCTMNK